MTDYSAKKRTDMPAPPMSTPRELMKIRNVRMFIAFRVFFNARFYYPIFTILFLDFGLTIEQFAVLNAVWAASIVLFEVPSGALADIMGRRNLLVTTSLLMIAEMAVLCFVPLGDMTLVFYAFLLNRILSGTAEAAASGADEALAYDSLKRSRLEDNWPRVLEMQMRYQSMGYIAAMSIGAAVYDPVLMQHAADLIGLDVVLNQQTTLRFPLYLCLLMAGLTFYTTLRMREETDRRDDCPAIEACGRSLVSATRLTLQAGRWILQTPFALVVISAGMIMDNVIRMVVTLSSQYYRLIHLPEATYGLIGSGLALMGLFIPRLGVRFVRQVSPASNFFFLAGLTLAGLLGLTWFMPYAGLIPVAILYGVMMFLNFFLSHYLNRITDSRRRATVLSFKGLSFNLAYGLTGLFYSGVVALERNRLRVSSPENLTGSVDDSVFMASIHWFPWYFLVLATIFICFALWRLKNRSEHLEIG
jgi:MFS family permease